MPKRRKRTYACRHCSKRYVPEGNTLAQTCPHCGKTTSKKTATRGQMVKLCDELFSVLVRFRDADSAGNVECVTCGVEMRWEDSQAGHFCKRELWPTRYAFKNVHPQCAYCNGPAGRGKEWEHGNYIDGRYGPGTAAALRAESQIDDKHSIVCLTRFAGMFHRAACKKGLNVDKILKRNRAASLMALGI